MKFSRKKRAPVAPASDLLNVGCGRRFHAAWVNLDFAPADRSILQYDARERLPFEDASFAAVYHSHLLEHLSRDAGRAFMRQCFRVLRPGGILRVAIPDLESIARLYLENLDRAAAGDRDAARRYDWIVLELLDQMTREESGGKMAKYWKQNPIPAEDFVLRRMGEEARRAINKMRTRPSREPEPAFRSARDIAKFRDSGEVHKWMYDRHSLSVLLRECGLVEPRLCRADESAIPRFNEFHLDTDEHGAVRKPDSLFMEAIKPAA